VSGRLNLQLAEEGADAERLGTLTTLVREELLRTDVEDVRRPRTGEAPPGTRAIDVMALGGLVVTLGRAATGMRDVIAVLRRWLSRGDGVRRTVKIEIDGDVLELSEVSAADQNRLIELFIGRHSTGEE